VPLIRWLFIATVSATPTGWLAQQGQPSTSTELCWRSLTPEAGPQGALAESNLVATRSGDIWLNRHSDGPNLLKWSGGKWTLPPERRRTGADQLWVEAVAASPSGRIAIAAAANRDDGSLVLHVGQMIDGAWQWLGAPLISSPDPFRHARRPAIAFVGERPVVAWSEELHADLSGLFVSLWNGSSWTRLGSLTPASEDSFLTPAIAVDSKQQAWLAWSDSGSRVRVVRWSGSAWLDVGRDSLDTLSDAQGRTPGRELSLAIDTKGRAWLLRSATKTRGAELALSRWDGTGWTQIPAPLGPAGKESTVWSTSMILRDDRPIVAWSQAGATDNRHLYVSEWAADNRWITRLAGLHLVEGVSNVNDVRLASADRERLFVAWDEPGKDGRSTRLVEAYACPAGETPAAAPKSTVERDTWPSTVEEAARRIAGSLDEESKARLRATKKEALIEYLHGWGTGIRNSLGLWRGNELLLASCGKGTRADPEACSMIIIEAVWTLVQR
jgi:hypothetical protein